MKANDALLKIQQELKAPKWQFNKFGGYKYRSCEDIIEAVKPLLGKYGCVLNMNDEIVCVEGRFYVKATATLLCEDWSFSTTAYAREEESKKWMDQAMVTWSSSSYARKYALCWLFAIDDGIDPDSTNKWEEKVEAKEEKKSDDKPWFNDPDLDKFVEFAKQYSGADDALKVIRTKYKVSKTMEAKVRQLYVSLDTIGD